MLSSTAGNHHRLSSTVGFASAVGERVREILARAACQWIQASPGCEQQRLQQGVLFCIFGPRWALKAINGWNVDVVQDYLLRIRRGQRVMLLESEDRGVLGSGLTLVGGYGARTSDTRRMA